eukprot:CAMPEP_0183717634 /NCGR_PEP_ID=MMETSP0737-20130205/11198_1 /TAXON_ID=385413 /ORGANISM="Thalassiosira miniscula, Strain CCMP1093" /LENGTH=313 /DNA_ID=CAMNT_0025947107 /DNA_START=92 /DNA_END=1033 /DNA_ORIENTATION=+
MLEKSPYPLLTLKLLGSLCPCLEKSDDGPARHAAWALSSVPIRWHRRLRSASSSGGDGGGGGGGGFLSGISGMFGGSSSGGGGALGGGDTYDPVEGATLTVVDATSGNPQLVASHPSHKKKCIPLKIIKHARARKGGIISMASRSGIEIIDATGRELLRFDVLKSPSSSMPKGGETEDDEEGWETTSASSSSNDNVEDAEESARDDIIDQLELLIEWERRRQAYIVTLGEDEVEGNAEEEYVEEYDDEDEEGGPSTPRRKKGAIAEKAQQIKHFAQREIELKKMKKEREDRKAKYVKEAGGLKYTAIAMANRA